MSITIGENDAAGKGSQTKLFAALDFKYKHSSSIDTESGCEGKTKRPPALRYWVVLVAVLSPFVVTYSRAIINFAIIDMIHPDSLEQNSQEQQVLSTELLEAFSDFENNDDVFSASNRTTNSSKIELDFPNPKLAQNTWYHFEHDNSCPVSLQTRSRLIDELVFDRKLASETSGEKFNWDTVQQGQLKAAFNIGRVFQIIGGRLAEVHGSHVVMTSSAMVIALACFTAPYLASVHFYLFFLNLLLVGILGSSMIPTAVTVFSNWLTPSEKSFMMTLHMMMSRLGFALSAILCGIFIEAQLSWRYLFYTAGWICVVFATLFWFIVHSTPHEHPRISQEELDYLVQKNRLVRETMRARQEAAKEAALHSGNQLGAGKDNRKKPSAPWASILTNGPVWAFIATRFCVKISSESVQIELPAYLGRVMHFPAKQNGYINAAGYGLFCVGCFIVGWLTKWTDKRRPFGLSKTTIRKIFQSVSSFGTGIALILVSTGACNSLATIVILILFFILVTVSVGGETQIPMDMSERYAGTLYALGNALSISGIIIPMVVGYTLDGHAADVERWSYLWIGAGAFSFLGGLVFLFMGDAEIQPFEDFGFVENVGCKVESDCNDHSTYPPKSTSIGA